MVEIVVPLGKELNESKTAVGRGTAARCDTAVAHALGADDRIIFVSPGFEPKWAPVGSPMYSLMARYMQDCSLPPARIRVPDVSARNFWTTREEIRATLEFTRAQYPEGACMTFVSGRYHLRRIRMLCRRLMTQEEFQKVRLMSAPGDRATAMHILHEWVATPYNLIRLRVER